MCVCILCSTTYLSCGRHDGICAHVIAANAFKDPIKINLGEWLRPKKRKSMGRVKKIHYLCMVGDTVHSSDEEADA